MNPRSSKAKDFNDEALNLATDGLFRFLFMDDSTDVPQLKAEIKNYLKLRASCGPKGFDLIYDREDGREEDTFKLILAKHKSNIPMSGIFTVKPTGEISMGVSEQMMELLCNPPGYRRPTPEGMHVVAALTARAKQKALAVTTKAASGDAPAAPEERKGPQLA